MKRYKKSITQIIAVLLVTALTSCASTPKNKKSAEELYFPNFETEDGKVLIQYNSETDTISMPFQLFKNIVLYIDLLNE